MLRAEGGVATDACLCCLIKQMSGICIVLVVVVVAVLSLLDLYLYLCFASCDGVKPQCVLRVLSCKQLFRCILAKQIFKVAL